MVECSVADGAIQIGRLGAADLSIAAQELLENLVEDILGCSTSRNDRIGVSQQSPAVLLIELPDVFRTQLSAIHTGKDTGDGRISLSEERFGSFKHRNP